MMENKDTLAREEQERVTCDTEAPDSENPDQIFDIKSAMKLSLGTLIVILLGLLSIAIYAIDISNWSGYPRLVSLGVLIGGAFGLLGSLLGFLFGIPITVPIKEDVKTEAETRLPARYQINTSLEQISDWLTKIIVGVGLTQLQNIPGKIRQAAQSLMAGLPNGEQHIGFATAVLLYSATSGFLLGYLWTRIVFAPWFRSADDKLREKIRQAKKAERVVEEKKQEAAQVTKAVEEKRQEEAQANQKAEEAQLVLKRANEFNDALRKMHDNLYLEEDGGFRETIRVAREFLDRWGGTEELLFWIRLASAYGQLYRWEKSQQNFSEADHLETKRNALEAIDKALQINKDRTIKWLEYLGNPKYPNKPNGENDLEEFWEDEDFKQRLS